MAVPIESYGLIGDCATAALVGADGSIDWLCWPRFDSDALFAALLGDDRNGRWLLGPADGSRAVSRSYDGHTLILETRFCTDGGEVTVTDLMPLCGTTPQIIRLVRGERGRVDMRMDLVVRFGYGRVIPWMAERPCETGVIVEARAGPDLVALHSPVPVDTEDERITTGFAVSAGDTMSFVLLHGSSFGPVPNPADPSQSLDTTRAFWTEWATNCSDAVSRAGEDPTTGEAVIRSLLTLKALTYAPSGGILAAVTTSLPEEIGGARNWDYRFCWLRDATITLLALMDGGYFDEASKWRDWLLRAVAGTPDQIQIMYGIAGERRLTEWTVDWLSGYESSRPVRIGNAAHLQLQLDVFGELMDTLHQARCGGLPENEAAWALQCGLLAHLETIWRDPDEGIWEVRGEPRHFTYSKVMAWVAFDRGIRSAIDFDLPGPVDRWRQIRDEIRLEVLEKGVDPLRGCFVQSYGSSAMDASLLLLPTVGFIHATEPLFRETLAAIERDLLDDGFVRRYDPSRTNDGLPGGEGAFLACSFWLADAYFLVGRKEEAERLFKRLLSLRNDVGLYSEEYDPRERRFLGNFPQAFSHVALVRTASRVFRQTDSEERRPARSRG